MITNINQLHPNGARILIKFVFIYVQIRERFGNGWNGLGETTMSVLQIIQNLQLWMNCCIYFTIPFQKNIDFTIVVVLSFP